MIRRGLTTTTTTWHRYGRTTLSSFLQTLEDKCRVGQMQLFDVSLRDGLQMADPEHYPFYFKEKLFTHIMTAHMPYAMEIGSVTRALPIMRDSLELATSAMKIKEELAETMGYLPAPHLYLLIPNVKGMDLAMRQFPNTQQQPYQTMHYSLLTSVSDVFQYKNTGKSMVEQKIELIQMRNMMRKHNATQTTKETCCRAKLYISCIAECPVLGAIPIPDILAELHYYHVAFPEFEDLCLSDTMGTLTFRQYRELIEGCERREIPLRKLSVHLHMLPGQSNWEHVRQIVWYSLRKGIYRFDVSTIQLGGCAMVFDKNKDHNKPNLTYRMLQEILYTDDIPSHDNVKDKDKDN